MIRRQPGEGRDAPDLEKLELQDAKDEAREAREAARSVLESSPYRGFLERALERQPEQAPRVEGTR